MGSPVVVKHMDPWSLSRWCRNTHTTGDFYNLAEDINKQDTARDQVRVLDIGGGLPVDYSSDLSGGEGAQQEGEYPTTQSYVSALHSEVPGLLDISRYTLVTEFGRFL